MDIGTESSDRPREVTKRPDTRNAPPTISAEQVKQELASEIAQAFAVMKQWAHTFESQDWQAEATYDGCSMIMTGKFMLGRVTALSADEHKRMNGIKAVKQHERQLKAMGFLTTLTTAESEFVLTAVHQASRDATQEDIMIPHPLNARLGFVKHSEAVRIEAEARESAVQRDEETRGQMKANQEKHNKEVREKADLAEQEKVETERLAKEVADKAEADRLANEASNQMGNNPGS